MECVLLATGTALLVSVAEFVQRRRRHELERRKYTCYRRAIPHPVFAPGLAQRLDECMYSFLKIPTEMFERIFAIFDLECATHPYLGSPGETRGRKRCVSNKDLLKFILRHLVSGEDAMADALIFGILAPCRSRMIRFALDVLFDTLRKMPEATMLLPRSVSEAEELTALVSSRYPRYKGCVGFVDGTQMRVVPDSDPFARQAQCCGRTGGHGGFRINNIVVTLTNGLIAFGTFNCPGSWTDAKAEMFMNLSSALERMPPDYFVVADKGFKETSRIVGPLRKAKARRLSGIPLARAKAISKELSKIRIAVEWGFAGLKNWFHLLNQPLPQDRYQRFQVIEVCCRLWNVRTVVTGENHILKTFLAWQALATNV